MKGKKSSKIITTEKNSKQQIFYHTKEEGQKSRMCIYCNKEGHNKSNDCKTIEKISGRRLKISKKQAVSQLDSFKA